MKSDPTDELMDALEEEMLENGCAAKITKDGVLLMFSEITLRELLQRAEDDGRESITVFIKKNMENTTTVKPPVDVN